MYEVKGVIEQDGKVVNAHWLMTDTTTLGEAVNDATSRGMYDFRAVHLSKIMEVFNNDKGGKWYRASVKEERERLPDETQPEGTTPRKTGGVIAITYDVLVKADDVAEASAFVKKQMEQGYDFTLSSVKEARIDEVI